MSISLNPHAEIVWWLENHQVSNYKINENGIVDVAGSVDISRLGLVSNLPFAFGIIDGDFLCNNNKFKSLVNMPKFVGGNFNCSSSLINTLEGCPIHIGGDFDCSYNKLTDLRFCIDQVGGSFNCRYNDIKSLEFGSSSVGGDYKCDGNQLTDLNFHPESVLGKFSCNFNKFENIAFEIMSSQEINLYYENKRLNKDLLVGLVETPIFKGKKI